MDGGIEALRVKLDALEREGANMRAGFLSISRQHNEAKAAMHQLAELSLAAAIRAAAAADNAVLATKKAAAAAKDVAAQKSFAPAHAAVQAATAAAGAAVEAATAATQAVSAAARAVAQDTENTAYTKMMQSVAKAEVEVKRANANAVDALKLAYEATEHLFAMGK